MTVYQIDENHIFETPDIEPEYQEPPTKNIITCRDTTREALEILLGVNHKMEVMSDSGIEGPSTGEPEPEIISAARSFRSKLQKEGIL